MKRKGAAIYLVVSLLTMSAFVLLMPGSSLITEAAPPGTEQNIDLFLGGTEDHRGLSPIMDGVLTRVESSGILAARGELFYVMTTPLGTWSTPYSPESFSMSGPVTYSLWMSGNVQGVFLDLELYLGTDRIANVTTTPINLDETPTKIQGSMNLPAPIVAPGSTPLSLSISWGGGQNIFESTTNNSVELWYGITSYDSSLSLRMAYVTIGDVTNEPHPSEDDALLFRITATSLFGPQDLVDVEVNAQISQGVLSDMEETIEGRYKVFTATWVYSELSFPGGVFNVTLSIVDTSGNMWDKASSLSIIFPEEQVDLSIVYSQVGISPPSPRVGDNVTIAIHFTGTGKNWGSVSTIIRVLENDQQMFQRQVSASLGNNGPFLFTWVPNSAGEHLITVVLDESIIDAPGLNASNNIVERMVTILPALENGEEESTGGIPPYMTIMGAIILVIVLCAALASAVISSSRRKAREERKYKNVDGGVVPVPSRAPRDAPSGFFIHSKGKPSVWVDTSEKKL